jgi:hypothetical protein
MNKSDCDCDDFHCYYDVCNYPECYYNTFSQSFTTTHFIYYVGAKSQYIIIVFHYTMLNQQHILQMYHRYEREADCSRYISSQKNPHQQNTRASSGCMKGRQADKADRQVGWAD